MLRPAINFVAFVALVYIAICALLFVFQRSLIYYPQPRAKGERSATMPLPVPGAELVISVRAHDGPNAIAYFGGNGEDVAYNLPDFASAFPDHALYLMNYRGYGGSTGKPTEQAIHQDALALFDWVHARHPNVVIVGRSLGSGFPVRWLLQDKYESWRCAPKITAPTLLLAAENDEVIPRASTEDLYTRFAPGMASLQVIPGVGHNTISNSPLYLTSLRSGIGL